MPGQFGVEHRFAHQLPFPGGQHLIQPGLWCAGGKCAWFRVRFTPPGGIAKWGERRFVRFGLKVARQQCGFAPGGLDQLADLGQADLGRFC